MASRFSSIEWLRIFAAIGVCLFHYFPTYESLQGSFPLLHVLAPKGFFGVDLFFVISGFAMATATVKASGAASPAAVFRLVARRGMRLYVPYWMTIPVAVLAVVSGNGDGLGQFKVVDTVFLTSLSHLSLLIPATWFLPYLMYFSVVYALSLLLPPSRRAHAYWLALGGLSLKALCGPGLSDLVLHPFGIEFLAGVLLSQTEAGRFGRRIVYIGLIILGVASFSLGVHLAAENNGWRALTYGCSAWCLVALLVKGELRWGFPLPAVARSLADATYALFLLHGPLLGLVHALGLVRSLQEFDPIWRELMFASGLGAVIALACAFHVCLERPVSRKLGAWLELRTSGWGR